MKTSYPTFLMLPIKRYPQKRFIRGNSGLTTANFPGKKDAAPLTVKIKCKQIPMIFKLLLLISVLLLIYSTALAQQTRTIKGTVKTGNGEQLAGVTIKEKQTNQVTITDSKGNFEIPVTINTGKSPVIVFSYTGYVTKEIEVGDQEILMVVLDQDFGKLDEVIVTAIGIRTTK